jgi:hypothetical protein
MKAAGLLYVATSQTGRPEALLALLENLKTGSFIFIRVTGMAFSMCGTVLLTLGYTWHRAADTGLHVAPCC